jgi:AcrR family transcriptional regulator
MDARMVRTRAALCEAMLAILERKALDHITVREIAETAGVGYATFFRHYRDKAALLDELAAQEVRELLDHALPVLAASDSRAACLALCAYVDARRKLWTTLLTGGAAAALREALLGRARAIAVANPPADDWLPADFKIVWAVGGCIDVLSWWLQQDRDYAAEQVAEMLDRLVVRPSLGRRGRSAPR